jgi:type III pantothenate kinase
MKGNHVPDIVIDAGNTRIKVALINSISELSVSYFLYDELDELSKLLQQTQPRASLLSGVVGQEVLQKLYEIIKPTIVLSHQTPLPIDCSNYSTFHTLGVDRIANAVAAAYFSNNRALVIDAGTCIKFDFVDSNKYMGGSISPGINMRFKALNEFTANLPFIDVFSAKAPLIGTNTHEAITSGVVNGCIEEVKGFVLQFNQQFQPISIFLTGGDANFFEEALKKDIFMDQNFTLKGLFLILQHNAPH